MTEIWVVKIYQNEVGWDGDAKYEFFASSIDAKLFAEQLEKSYTEATNERQRDLYTLEIDVDVWRINREGVRTEDIVEEWIDTLYENITR